ncbi:MAG: hypothetical protein M3015_10060, partial [Bacteroidota bacterium]|nr:hypothetical protein [Bacteroidota bacterium]
MTPFSKYLLALLFTGNFCLLSFTITAQEDSSRRKTLEDYVRDKKGILVKVVKGFMKNSEEDPNTKGIIRNDQPFLQYQGAIIRNVMIIRLPFGTPIADSAKKVATTLTKLANTLHHTTRNSVIKNNLFFNKNDTIKPYLLADNVRFLRQLPYIQDATFIIVPVIGTTDSVDVLIKVKDLFSISGAIGSIGLQRSDIEVREDNIGGYGNGLVFQTLFDNQRKSNFGFGFGYTQRNIGGSFINGDAGYKSFYSSITGPKEENYYYLNFSKPLVNRYMRWTYEFNSSYHSTRNLYGRDSSYYTDSRYQYYNFEAWAGYNINAKGYTIKKEDHELRKLVGLRLIDRKFQDIPSKYISNYYWRYADITGVLGSVTFYRQNFYKTQFIYGFGRNEDIPEGLNLTLTAGYTKKQNVLRSFLGFNYQRSFFNDKKNYVSYTIRAEGNLRGSSLEDINFLGGIAYFDHLKNLGAKWKQRFFLNLDVAQQVNTIFNEPLLLESNFGLPEFGHSQIGGTLRATIKAESVFFSPVSVASFRFAPFVFANTSLFSPYLSDAHIYSSVGAGL